MKEKIRWGIVGLGNIAQKFADDLKLIADGELTAVASRDIQKAKRFGELNNAKHAFGSYQELFACTDVDVVYIATPHTSHADLSIMAMNEGRNVLCEKPMGINRGEVERMIASARKNNVFLMEALWSRFNPSIRKVKNLIDEGIIGEVGYLHADFAFYALDKDINGRLLNPALAGGSLLDIGIYPIFLAYLILGFPEKIMASSKIYKTGVDIQTSMIFEYSNAQAILYSGLTSNSEMKAEISGSEGTVFLTPRWHEAQEYSVEKNDKLEKVQLPTRGKGYEYEIVEVHQCLRNGKLESDLWSLKNTYDLIRIMDNIRKQTGVVFPFEQ
ncbi:Gfo/Idh/MocA family oxidoreductase [uncultured Eudoraea sp.]|jgi:predicted dehydrogenase|uniref:Gfo/Idh/MocA family protein n=1 Tax=uncultured Eudoraea sp. TaxID=1035614 RepID=UPI0026093FC6|nr:Gfo/Idh/MocA family oxidoreductase [uncultured Eudoraea sp.]